MIFHYQFVNILSGSPSVSSLTYDNQSRTFTCTSTGGPATTVTWKRDGAVITLNATYQQTKRVVDPVTGTYQTVLTVDPSVSQSDIVGAYECTVENTRGRSSVTRIVADNGELMHALFVRTREIMYHHQIIFLFICQIKVKHMITCAMTPAASPWVQGFGGQVSLNDLCQAQLASLPPFQILTHQFPHTSASAALLWLPCRTWCCEGS